MQPYHSNIIVGLSRRLMAAWRHHRLQGWQQMKQPRLLCPFEELPGFVQHCSITMSALPWLRLLDWSCVPNVPHSRWFGHTDVVPLSAYLGAYLLKLDQGLRNTRHLHRFLVTHPALVWALGFPLHPSHQTPHGFDAQASLPTPRHFNRVLSELPQPILQALLSSQVKQLQQFWPDTFGQTISLDTKHILAWVKENNPKQFIKEGRFDKTRQPAGDPDCKLGCKRRHNRIVLPPTTPTSEGKPAGKLPVSVGEFYWGYASGAVVTKVEGVGEFVLAEMTQTFDRGDTTYFFPLMQQVEERLGFRPRFAALDAAFDAFYVYDYFHSPDHEGFAAVPLSEKGGQPTRRFTQEGVPLCDVGLPMSFKFTFMDRTSTIVEHQRVKYVCPLRHPQATGETCPIAHKSWPKGGCTTHFANSPGSRIRHQLDRQSEKYKLIFAQRTVVERIFAQAVALGMERPKLRNQKAIANQNTLIYLLINLRAMQRLLASLAHSAK